MLAGFSGVVSEYDQRHFSLVLVLRPQASS
jgi:hypothetical protein